MIPKFFVFALLACGGIAWAQATTLPTAPPPDLITQRYVNSVDKAKNEFHAAIAKLAKLRDIKLTEVQDSAEQLKRRALQSYSDEVDKLARIYGEARQSALAQAGQKYDQQMRDAMTAGKTELLVAIKTERSHFVDEVALAEQKALDDAKSLRGPASPPPAQIPIVSGPVIADHIIAVTDDFIVDVYQNGQKVPDSARTLDHDMFGATMETIKINVHRDDWLVFNIANDRLRWDGACGFIAVGFARDGAIAFATKPESHLWSYCDDVDKVSRFIAEPAFMQYQYARTPKLAWKNAAKLKEVVGKSGAVTIWGGSRNTWIKFIASMPK